MPGNPIVIHPSKIKWTVRMVVGGLLLTPMLTGSFTLILAGFFYLSWASSLVLGVLLATPVVWTFILVSLVVCFVGDVPRLEIGPDGFVIRELVRSRSQQWHDIEGDFVVRGTPFGWEVAYRLTGAFKKFQKIAAQSAGRGAFESVGNCFEMPTAEVAELLNQHKRQATGSC